jgi:hypothetical protein
MALLFHKVSFLNVWFCEVSSRYRLLVIEMLREV